MAPSRRTKWIPLDLAQAPESLALPGTLSGNVPIAQPDVVDEGRNDTTNVHPNRTSTPIEPVYPHGPVASTQPPRGPARKDHIHTRSTAFRQESGTRLIMKQDNIQQQDHSQSLSKLMSTQDNVPPSFAGMKDRTNGQSDTISYHAGENKDQDSGLRGLNAQAATFQPAASYHEVSKPPLGFGFHRIQQNAHGRPYPGQPSTSSADSSRSTQPHDNIAPSSTMGFESNETVFPQPARFPFLQEQGGRQEDHDTSATEPAPTVQPGIATADKASQLPLPPSFSHHADALAPQRNDNPEFNVPMCSLARGLIVYVRRGPQHSRELWRGRPVVVRFWDTSAQMVNVCKVTAFHERVVDARYGHFRSPQAAAVHMRDYLLIDDGGATATHQGLPVLRIKGGERLKKTSYVDVTETRWIHVGQLARLSIDNVFARRELEEQSMAFLEYWVRHQEWANRMALLAKEAGAGGRRAA